MPNADFIHAGVASSVVGVQKGVGYEKVPSIDIIKLGDASITQTTEDGDDQDAIARWGDYSASQVFGDCMWFAVPIAKQLSETETNYREAWRSWVAVEDLVHY